MKTTCDFLDAVKARHCIPSDYALAKKLGTTHQTVSKYRVGKDYLGDSTAIRVAQLLEIEPGFVLATVHRERAKKDDEKAAWTAIIEKLGGVAASALIGLAAMTAPPPSYAYIGTGAQHESILCQINEVSLSTHLSRCVYFTGSLAVLGGLWLSEDYSQATYA